MPTKDDCGKTPSALGYRMPAEWEKHEATWLGWPHNPEDWPDKLDPIRWVYGEMVRRIGTGEKVRILVRNRTEETLARHTLSRAGASLRPVEFIHYPTNRDPDFRNTKAVSDEEFERLVLNVYKVLLTRGMLGTLIVSVDEETQRLLQSLTSPPPASGPESGSNG